MICKFCGSQSQTKFIAEIAVHSSDFKKPHVFVFPDLFVCLDCGKAEFKVTGTELDSLKQCRVSSAASVGANVPMIERAETRASNQ
jgi:hypothetical protein